MKKKVLIIAAIIVASLALLIFIALLAAPKIARSYIVGHSQEFIGRDIQIESISLNPFTFKLTIDSLAVMEQDGKTPFVSFDELRVNIDPLRLLGGTAAVSEIYLGGLYAHVSQNGDLFNFSDILDHLNKGNADSTAQGADSSSQAQQNTAAASAVKTVAATDDAKADSASAPLNIAKIVEGLPVGLDVKNIKLDNWTLFYEDQKVGSAVKLDSFTVEVPAVYFYDTTTSASVRFKFTEGGEFKVNAGANLATSDFHADVEMNEFTLAYGKPYTKDILNYKDLGGQFTMFVSADGNLNQALAANIKGFVALDSIKITETSGEALGVNRINVALDEINLQENKFTIDSVVVDGAFANFNMYKGGKTNIDVLLSKPKKGSTQEQVQLQMPQEQSQVVTQQEQPKQAEAKQAEPEKAEPSKDAAQAEQSKMQLLVKKLLVKNTALNVSDHTIIKPFKYRVSGITVSGSNVSLDAPTAINVSVALPEGGAITAKYKGAISDPSTLEANVNIKNMALKHFSNYSIHYTGYPITGGVLAFASDNKIVKNKIDSKNIIDIYNIEVGDKLDDVEAQFTVPMKIGLYILKDRHDKIQINTPVKGNLKDPEFSYGKIIWNTVMNLLIKVAFSPFKIVGNLAASGANAIGLDLGNKDEIILNANVATFTSEQYAKAIQMTDMLKKDRKLKLTFTQYYNPAKVLAEYKTYKMKENFYKTKNHKNVLTEVDRDAIAEISDSDDEFEAFAKTQEATLNQASLQRDIGSLASKRNAELNKILRQQHGINAKNIRVITAGKDDLSSYKGKPKYKVTVDVQ